MNWENGRLGQGGFAIMKIDSHVGKMEDFILCMETVNDPRVLKIKSICCFTLLPFKFDLSTLSKVQDMLSSAQLAYYSRKNILDVEEVSKCK